MDYRPICDCGAYHFPHKLGGGKCDGSAYAEYYSLHVGSSCEGCNCYQGGCDVIAGKEKIKYGECYVEAYGGGHVRLEPADHEIDEYNCEYML